MSERILRSTSDKTNLFPPLSMTKREDPATSEFPMSNESSQPLPVETKECQSPTSSANASSDLQITMQMLQKIQLDISKGIQELRKELKIDFAGHLDHVNTRMEQLASRIEQAENRRREETTKTQVQIDTINATNSTITHPHRWPRSKLSCVKDHLRRLIYLYETTTSSEWRSTSRSMS